ncbi:hypothetical protein [Baekduia sp. Peel2402]|uniref:hypothetical protein n=1 Tax=Baekduia sp. Peel2402 TaxID=3458296 RepID=UPI00403EAC4C
MPDDDLLPDRPPRRGALEGPYQHPFRESAGAIWHAQPTLRHQAALSGVLIVGGWIGALALSSILFLTVAAGAMLGLFVLLVLGWWSLRDGLALIRRARQKSELRSVLEARPHAGEQDADFAHELFAVSAEDDGWLYTWRFRPLRLREQPDDDEVEVPGRPRYAAEVVTEARFDVHDAARAAEQLVLAQDAAATREAAAAATAFDGVHDAATRAELAQEARSTAAALQRATGQRRPRD